MLSMRLQVPGLLGRHSLTASHLQFVPKRRKGSPTNSGVMTILSATSRTSCASGPLLPVLLAHPRRQTRSIPRTRRTQHREIARHPLSREAPQERRGRTARHDAKTKSTTPSASKRHSCNRKDALAYVSDCGFVRVGLGERESKGLKMSVGGSVGRFKNPCFCVRLGAAGWA